MMAIGNKLKQAFLSRFTCIGILILILKYQIYKKIVACPPQTNKGPGSIS